MAVDSSTSSHVLLPCNFFSEGAGALEKEGVSWVGGAEKTGKACLICTGGGGRGGAEKTGTALLIVTGGAIPW